MQMELKEAKREVIYKVGRNVLMFQQMEHLSKYLVANGSVSGHKNGLTQLGRKLWECYFNFLVLGLFFSGDEPQSFWVRSARFIE